MTSFCFFPASDSASDSSSDESFIIDLKPGSGGQVIFMPNEDFYKSPTISNVYVICGMTGSGKDTVFEKASTALKDHNIFFSRIRQSTTRSRRENEPADAYNFLNKEDFISQQSNKLFLEVMNFGDYFYATPRLPFLMLKNSGQSRYLIIGIQGVLALYQELVLLNIDLSNIKFIHVRCAESDDNLLEESMKRIESRGKDSKELLEIRRENNAKDVALIQSANFNFINKEILNLEGCSERAAGEFAAYILDQERQS